MDEKYYNPTKEKRKNNIIVILITIIIILLGIIIWQQFRTSSAIRTEKVTYSENLQLKSEFDSLMAEYTTIKEQNADFAAQLTDRDSAIASNAKEIEKLIASQADYRKIKKKLELLRNITQDYVSRIDSLIIVNTELTEENQEIKRQVNSERKMNSELKKSNEELETKITVASEFKAYNLKATPVRLRSGGDKESETDKASRADRINVCFTLSENKIVAAGDKIIYVRLARPDGVVVSEGDSDDFSFLTTEGQRLQYSMKKMINYKNTAQEVCVFWTKRDKASAAMSGTYNVAIYLEGKEIGRSSFSLK